MPASTSSRLVPRPRPRPDGAEHSPTEFGPRLDGLGVSLRPHLKTAKSVEVARQMMTPPRAGDGLDADGGQRFAAAGVRDITYGVGIAPPSSQRSTRCAPAASTLPSSSTRSSRRSGAEAVAAVPRRAAGADRDRLRRPSLRACRPATAAAQLRRTLHAAGRLRGVLTHAGDSYGAGAARRSRRSPSASAAAASPPRRAAGRRAACPVVSVGSTPTALFATNLAGVTEVRAGVFVVLRPGDGRLGVCGSRTSRSRCWPR